MPNPFDPSLYNNAPQITLSTGITLARSLVKLAPKNAGPLVKKAVKKLSAAADSAQDKLADRQRELGAVSEEDARGIDNEADGSWGALRDRLSAYATLPDDRFPRAARAASLLTTLFGDGGLTFLQSKYDAQLAVMDTLLKRIDADGLAKEIDELAGPEFLSQIRHVHPRYEAMVHGRLRRESGSGQNLLEEVRALRQAILYYASMVSGTVDEDDPRTAAAAEEALRPIVTFRAQNTRRGGAAVPPAAVAAAGGEPTSNEPAGK